MTFFPRRFIPVVLILAALLAIGAFWVFPPDKLPSPPPPRKIEPPPALSLLATPPDWQSLEIYQYSITRADFEKLLTSVFTTGEAWRPFIGIDDHGARIETGDSGGIFTLRFAPPGGGTTAARHWRTTSELPPTTPDKPLAGMKIAIDPGHIGGDWAKMEERWLVVADGPPVCEGDMTLQVANLLKPKLEALGATVSLVREKNEPVTAVRPDDLLEMARESSAPDATPEAIRRTAERLFYRTAEIRARADLVNQVLKPDLVLCLHFNAEGWGDPAKPVLIDRTHLHLLLNGAYNDAEVVLADQRYALLRKLLQRTHQEEALVGAGVANTFAEITGLPPYQYPPDSPNVRPVAGQPYLWVRNLLANRLYDCPVIFMEPYVMNSTIDFPRCQAGDYEGLKEIGGKMQPSIFREYAEALTEGLVRHYSTSRSLSEH